MDPLLFGIDGEVAFEVLGVIVLMALLIERALSVIFEWRPLVDRLNNRGLKEPITIIVAALVCWHYDFDALAVLFHGEKVPWQGLILTALIVAGGSKGSVKLFRDQQAQGRLHAE